MRLVADTSELFSFFNSESKARELSLSSRTELFAPYYALEELREKKRKIIKCFSLTEAQYAIIIKLLETVVKYIRVDEYSECLPESMELCPDPNDVDFFALALKLDCPLWSEDRLLKKTVKDQGILYAGIKRYDLKNLHQENIFIPSFFKAIF